MSLREAELIILGHFEQRSRVSRDHWDMTRFAISMLLGPHLKQGKSLSPTDVLRFPDEISLASPIKDISPEDRQKLFDKLDKATDFKPLTSIDQLT